jgi:hypothetical protein
VKKLVVLGTSLAALFAAGCQDQATAPTLAPDALRASVSAAEPLAGALGLSAPTLPAAARLSDVGRVAAPAINPGDYVCSAATPVTNWLTAQIVGLPRADLQNLAAIVNQRLVTDVLVYDALFFESASRAQTFGAKGEYTQIVRKTEKDLKRFWDIPSGDIETVGLHGRMLADTARVARVYREVYGLPAATAAVWASQVQVRVVGSPALNGGDFAYLTFNAFAYSPGDGSMPDKIILGDGVLTGYSAIGLGDVAPQAIYAHEYAHQVQYERGYFDDAAAGTTLPEQTRYSELMADAYAAYFLTHARGAAMNQKRVEQFLATFFNTGDCSYASPGHHGTPNQRMAAARLGFTLADEAQKQGHILSSEAFHARFVAAYPTLIAPDAR